MAVKRVCVRVLLFYDVTTFCQLPNKWICYKLQFCISTDTASQDRKTMKNLNQTNSVDVYMYNNEQMLKISQRQHSAKK